MRLAFIVAHARNGVIGREGQIPWYLPEDLKHFKTTTFGKPVIMGRKTFESLPKALPGRRNIVVTSKTDYAAPGAEVVPTIEAALALVKDAPLAFIMGGASLYAQTVSLCDEAYITRINADFEGDAFFSFDTTGWTLVEEETFPATDAHPFSYAFLHYEKA
ncbi:MAG TPA: dihydrofolate reductase [Sutterella sp.]|nr:dihydrofolate reductase [Sutterella sp.]